MEQSSASEARMPLWEHLDELRRRLVYSLLGVLVGFAATYSQAEKLVRFLEEPLLRILPPAEAHLYFTGITDKFFTYFQVSLYAAIFLTSPFLLYQAWLFIAPALHRNEKRFLAPFLILGSVFFVLGLAFAFYVLLPFGYQFLLEYGSPNEKAMITLTEYFSLTVKLLLAMGLVFELPVLIVLLAKFGIIDAAKLSQYRRQAAIAIAVLSAIITPTPDAFTMVLVMVPLWLLYELGILGARWIGRSAT